MSYFYLILQAVIFSFGGLMIKASKTMVSPFLLSAIRFAIGILLLMGIQLVQNRKITLTLTGRILILGGVCKAIHYLGENFGVMRGFSYGGILVWPVQTIVVLVVSVLIYKERLQIRTVLGSILCVTGIGIVSVNGASPEEFFSSQATTLLAFIIAGIGAALFTVSQKKLLTSMNITEMNSSMFVYGLLTALIVLPVSGPHTTGQVTTAGIISILLLGIITCVGFLLQAAAIRTVPLLIATIIQSSTVILTILWGVLFYGDPITVNIIAGTTLFLIGIIVINVRPSRRTRTQSSGSSQER